MAVQPQTPYKEYTANGSTNSFALEFDCDNQDHLIVLVDDIEPVVGAWSLIGGAVVFGTAPTNGKKITIQRNTPFRRDGDFQSYDNSFRPGPVNKGFDWIWLKLQELGVADWILSTRINDLRAYVERQDSVLQENIDNLKTYVDDRDDELRAYLLEEISKQGVALDQLDEYYNYLMQRLAQIAVSRGWDASFIADAGGSTQQDINDFGGAKWRNKAGGYALGATVKLDNGDIVKSTIPNNINDPDVDMTGWVNPKTEQQQINNSATVNNSILNYTQSAEIADAFVTALAQSNNLILNSRVGNYTVSSNKTITLQRDTVLDLNNQQIDFTGNIVFTTPLLLTTSLNVNTSRYATSVTLNSAAGINAGDLLYILTSVIAETQWNYKKQDCVRIKSISGNTVELEEPLQFAYSTTDLGLVVTAYKKTKLTIKNPKFNLIGVVGSGMFDLQYLSDIEIENPVGIGSRTDWDPSTNELRRMFRLKSCFNISVNNAEFFALSYPILFSDGARNLTVSGVKAQNCRHTVESTSWAKNAIINDLIGSDNYASISAHPAFDIQYNNAVIERDQRLPNLRCVRGELNNVKIHTLSDDTSEGPYFQSLLLTPDASYLYDDADLTLEKVRINAPNRTLACLGVYRARNVYVSGCRDKAFSTNTNNGVTGNIYFGQGNSFNDKETPKIGVGGSIRLNKVRVTQNPLINAVLKSGVYDLNFRDNIVDQANNFQRAYGEVVSNLAGDQTITLRVHTNCFTNTDNVNLVNVNLKLKGVLKHNNAGGYAYQERQFNFMHKASTISSISAPLAPIYSSLQQGTTNESLDITITSVTQVGRTEAGANGDYYIDIAISLISGRTSPVYSLSYELELSSL